MATQPFQNFGRKLDQAFSGAREELRRGVDYVDRVIVPEIRHEGATAARNVASQLNRFADHLEFQPGHQGFRPNPWTAADPPSAGPAGWNQATPNPEG